MRIIWSRHAYNSLSDVLDYSEESFGLERAEKMKEKILCSIDRLGVFPVCSPVIAEISSETAVYRKLVVTREISVIYRVQNDDVLIDFIWDIRRSLHHLYYLIHQS